MSTPIPETVQYGFVQGRIVLSVGDDSDEDQLPNAVPAVGAVSFTALNRITREYEATPPTTVVSTRVTRALNENGVLVNTDGTPGVWLSVGPHKVAYLLDDVEIPRHDIEVTALHTPDNPLDITEAIPPGGPVLTPSEYADLMSKFTTLETRVVDSVAAPAAQASIDAASASASATSASSSATSALNSANAADADRIAAEAAKLAAQSSEESAAISETSAVQAAVASIAARDISVSAKDTSVAAKDGAVIAKTAAEAARDISISAKDTSVSAKDTSVAAKDDAVIAKTAAETAATNAQQAVTVHETAADPHTQYHTNARGDARYAAPTGTNSRLQVAGVNVAPEQVGAAPALGADDNYVTDAQLAALHSHANKTALDQVSGVNTGDQDLSGLLTTAAAPERIRDTMGTALVAGDNVTITLDDNADTITIAASGSGGAAGIYYPIITSGWTNWWAGPVVANTGNAGWATALNTISFQPFYVTHPVRITAFRVLAATAGSADAEMLFGMYETTVPGGDPLNGQGSLLASIGTVSMSTTGDKIITGLSIDLQPSLYWVAALQVGTTAGTLRPSYENLSTYLFVPKRVMHRTGGLTGQNNLTALPATTGSSDTWNFSVPGWFNVQTEVIA